MKTLVNITTRHFENYSDTDTPSWRNKGQHTFHLDTDMYNFMYDELRCIDAINLMLFELSNEHERFEYVSHELVFSTPTKLHEQLFLQKLKDLDNIKYVHE
jgi:hypothetical protein